MPGVRARVVIRFGIEYKRRRINFVLHELNTSTTPRRARPLHPPPRACLTW